MKKYGFVLLLSILVISCNGNKGKEVEEFARDFAEKASGNQIGLLKQNYPQLEQADSIALDFASDAIKVTETEDPDIFNVSLSPKVTIKVKRDNDGRITVIESKGLFAYAKDEVDLAKNTGQWSDDLNDVDLNARIKDTGFKEYLKNLPFSPENIISINIVKDAPYGEGYYRTISLSNNTDKNIEASDYKINIRDLEWDWDNDCELWTNRTEKGVDLGPNAVEEKQIFISSKSTILSIKFSLSEEELKNRYAKYTGKEYQEYLNTKK